MKKIISILICVLLLTAFAAPLTALGAGHESKVVRVGWYESAFHHTDDFGRRSGYGYEYQQRIATYTGWTYEYVEGSWSELFEKLVAGELDLLSDVSYTEARAEQILYSAEEMGSEDYHAFISPDNTEISPDDFSSFNGKRVGVNKNSYQEQLLIEWAKNHNVTPEIIELSGKSPELLEMLAKGEIDMLVTLDAYASKADVVSVCKIGSAYSYFGINKNRPDLKQDLDVAMNRIFEDNRYFNQQMAEKYLSTRGIVNFLTPDEIEWLGEHGTIRVGYRADFMPFCGVDDASGQLAGALADYLKFAENCEKNAELSFETRAFATMDDGFNALENNEIDCLFPLNLSSYDGEQLGLIISDPFVTTEMFAAVRTADHMGISNEKGTVVAMIDGHRNHRAFVMDHFPEWEIKYFPDSDSCFKAVADGYADCTLISNYRLNRRSGECEKYGLSTLATGEAMNLSFAVRRQDDCLYSILNKVTSLLPNATINASLTKYSFMDDKVTFGEFIKDNLALFVGIVAAIIIVILILVLKGARSAASANEGRKIISETERDHLTNLYNRSFFMMYANRVFRSHPEKRMDAIVINIDRFHSLNALNGRDLGDEVLRALGSEIEAYLRENYGIAARIEGDYFDIFCAQQGSYQGLLDRLQMKLNSVTHNRETVLRMGVMPWQENMPPEKMFDHAWSACTMVRRNYKTHLMVYDEKMRKRDQLNLTLLNDFERALEQHEFKIYFQPKYDIRSEKPVLASVEALVRWKHPKLGMITPDDFIPLFERNGQITALDNYVWNESARQIADWRDRFGKSIPASVNLSRLDVFDPKLSSTLEGIVEKYGLKHSDLKLEVTESAYTENADHLIRVIGELREKGYEIEMDDFGSGYSSLNMLSHMPIDVLKMDIGFIRNIERNERDMRLVELIIDLARNLKVLVVAEGVETDGQLKLLKDAGCDLAQGYYFSRPLPLDEFEKKYFKNNRKG